MAVPKVPFNHDGGPIKISIEYQGLVAANYTYTLWEANSNNIIEQRQGNNQNPQDDSYKLPSPTSDNIDRLIDVHSTVWGMYENENEGNYKVKIAISQDNETLYKSTQPLPPKPIGNKVVAHQFYALLV